MKKQRLQFGFAALIAAAFILAGCANGTDGGGGEEPNKAATPTANPAAGAVQSGTEITLTSDTDGADIYYTLDGSEPGTAGAKYSDTGKPKITAAVTLKAIAVKDGMTNSDVLTAAYTIGGTSTLTITGLGAYNGMGAYAIGNIGAAYPSSFDPNAGYGIDEGGLIANGIVALKVWQFDVNTQTSSPYTGSDTGTLLVRISDGPGNWSTEGTVTVTFSNGSATGAFKTLNETDFGAGVTPTIINPDDYASGGLKDYLETRPAGNYVVNVDGEASAGNGIHLSTSGVTISLRGSNNAALLAESSMSYGLALDVQGGAKVILRDIAVKGNQTGQKIIVEGTLVMEAGSSVQGSSSSYGVIAGDNSVFIMRGGEIYGNGGGGVKIVGENASFEKTGGIIYGYHASGNSNGTSNAGWGAAVTVHKDYSNDPDSSVALYRDNDVTDNLSVTLNSAGDGIANQTGNWEQ